MSEKVLNLPLSGAEVQEALLDRVEQALRRDCNLHPNNSYDVFSARITIDLKLHDMGTEYPVKIEAKLAMGEEVENMVSKTATAEMVEKPPNEVRVESGQGVPVSARGPDGRPTIKHMKYARNRVKLAKEA